MKKSGNFLYSFDKPTITYQELVCQVVNDLMDAYQKDDEILKKRELIVQGELQYMDFIKKDHLEKKEVLDKLEEILELMMKNYSLEYVLEYIWKPVVLWQCRACRVQEDDANDIFQSIAIKYNEIRKKTDINNLRAYMIKTIKSQIKAKLKNRDKDKEIFVSQIEYIQEIKEDKSYYEQFFEPDLLPGVTTEELLNTLPCAVQTLTKKDKDIIFKRFFLRMKHWEISESLGKNDHSYSARKTKKILEFLKKEIIRLIEEDMQKQNDMNEEDMKEQNDMDEEDMKEQNDMDEEDMKEQNDMDEEDSE